MYILHLALIISSDRRCSGTKVQNLLILDMADLKLHHRNWQLQMSN